MDCRVVDRVISIKYNEGVKNFFDYAFRNIALLVEGRTCCPCNRCVKRKMHYRDTVISHLYKSGFMQNYKH